MVKNVGTQHAVSANQQHRWRRGVPLGVLIFMGSYNEIFSLVPAHAAVAHPLSGATKDAKRSVSLLALFAPWYSRIPPPTADLPKRFGLYLLTAHINGALLCFYWGFYPPASAVSTAGKSFGLADIYPLVWYLRLKIALLLQNLKSHPIRPTLHKLTKISPSAAIDCRVVSW